MVTEGVDVHADTSGRAFRRIGRDRRAMTPDGQARLREERKGLDWSAIVSGRPRSDASLLALEAVVFDADEPKALGDGVAARKDTAQAELGVKG